MMDIIKEDDGGGWSRISDILRGSVITINTFGIVTAENPMGVEHDEKWNFQANKGKHPTKNIVGLEGALKDAHLGYKQIQGYYGSLENPYFVPNISKNEIMRLGKSYDQKSVIFGQKTENGMEVWEIATTTWEDESSGKKYQFGDIVAGPTNVFIRKDEAEHYYSQVGKQPDLTKPKHKDKPKQNIATTHKFTFPFPEYGYEDYEGAYWGEDGKILKNVKEKARSDEEFQRYTNLLIENSLNENRVGKDRWISRYRLLKYIKEYRTINEAQIDFNFKVNYDPTEGGQL